MKKIIKTVEFFALTCVLFTACPTENGNGVTGGNELEALDSYVSQKYANGASDSRNSDQTKWNAANCHDPKLFQDDDGTYYVYATDASCGNIGNVGLHIRYSKDLVNWTGVENSAISGFWDKDFLAWEDFTASSSETLQNNTSYTAYTWAPTVIKLNDLYYMYHGVNADVGTSNNRTRAASSIVLAIASSAKGPFYPASEISSFDESTETRSNYLAKKSDILAIKAKLEKLGVTYKQNFLVRYAATGSSIVQTHAPSLDGTEIEFSSSTYGLSNNTRFGCIDPEFVYDVATGSLKTYTIGSNECYAMIYGSWMYGIALIYVDSTSLKPVATSELSYTDSSDTSNSFSYKVGDELDIPLDKANLANNAGSYGCLGTRIAGGYGAGYEGAQLIYNSKTDYYYIITSCGGLMYEYRCTVGRSKDIGGPYYDAGGKNMVLSNTSTDSNYSANYHAIGSKIIGSHALKSEYSFRSQGGLSILRTQNGKIIFACHTRTNFQEEYYFYLQCHQMFFNEDGWPVLNQNEYYDDYSGVTTDGTESLCRLSVDEIAGTYDTILTVRGTETDAVSELGIYGGASVSDKVNKADAVPTESKRLKINADGSLGGSNYSGTWTLADDGYSATINLKDSEGNELGTFKGYFMHAVDWAKKGDNVERRIITFTSLDYDEEASDAEAGEYFWGNRKN